MPKKTVLLTLTVAVEVSDEEPDRGLSELAQLETRLSHALKAALGKPASLGWQALCSRELNPESSNCGQCEECGGWVTDRERPEPLMGLCIRSASQRPAPLR